MVRNLARKGRAVACSRLYSNILVLVSFLLATSALADDLQYYGRVDYALTHASSGSATHNGVEGLSLENNFSLLGVRGSEPMGEQWDFVWQFEVGVSAEDQDNGQKPFTARPTFAGFSGPYGKLTVGMMDPVLKLTKGFVDAFDNYSTKHDRLVPGDKPHGDSVQYWSPRRAGLRLGATYLLADEYFPRDDPRRDNGNYQLAVTFGDKFFRTGNLYLAAAYSDGVEDIEAWRGVVHWQAGPWLLGGMYMQSRQVNPAAADWSERDGAGYFASLVRVAGNWRFKVQAGRDDSGNGWVARRVYAELDDAAQAVPEIAMVAAGLEYYFTGKLRLHAEWGLVRAEGFDSFDDDLVSAGLRYEF
jgi:outer membrane pore protein F